MATFPQTDRSDLRPEKYSNPKKNRGESFDDAMNAPNDPQKRYRPESFNVTDDYCSEETGESSDSDD
jgi:hypothetical protein